MSVYETFDFVAKVHVRIYVYIFVFVRLDGRPLRLYPCRKGVKYYYALAVPLIILSISGIFFFISADRL